MSKVNRLLRLRMLECDVTVPDMAKKLQVSTNTIYAKINGKKPFKTTESLKIMEILLIPDAEIRKYF